jgi:hypothetical protein
LIPTYGITHRPIQTVMSGPFLDNKEDSNKEVLYGPTYTEDSNNMITSNEKSCCSKHSTTESDSEVTQPKKKVFISEHFGQSKSTGDS